jgi:hypothetical protein
VSDEGFFARWSRRKAGIAAPVDERDEAPSTAAPAMPSSAVPSTNVATSDVVRSEPVPAADAAETAPQPPAPTLADVAALTRGSDFTRFMAPGVDTGVRNAAMKKLFSDPHFNVMDGLDVYIDDYGKPDPLPLEMLKKLRQSEMLGLFRDDTAAATPAATAAEASADNAGIAASPPSTPGAQSAPPTDASRAEDDPDLQLQPDDGDRRPGAGEGARD